MGLLSHAQQLLTTSGTYVVPANVNSITVELVGRGGSAGSNGGGGGGGGGYSKGTFSVTPGQSIAYTVAETARTVADVKYSASALGDWLIPVLLICVIGACGYMIWQRISQRKGGWA